jgi:hypothetical protein
MNLEDSHKMVEYIRTSLWNLAESDPHLLQPFLELALSVKTVTRIELSSLYFYMIYNEAGDLQKKIDQCDAELKITSTEEVSYEIEKTALTLKNTMKQLDKICDAFASAGISYSEFLK